VCRTRVCDATDGNGTENSNSELQGTYGLFAPMMLLHSSPGKIASRFSRIQFRIIWVGTPDILALQMTDISYARSA